MMLSGSYIGLRYMLTTFSSSSCSCSSISCCCSNMAAWERQIAYPSTTKQLASKDSKTGLHILDSGYVPVKE